MAYAKFYYYENSGFNCESGTTWTSWVRNDYRFTQPCQCRIDSTNECYHGNGLVCWRFGAAFRWHHGMEKEQYLRHNSFCWLWCILDCTCCNLDFTKNGTFPAGRRSQHGLFSFALGSVYIWYVYRYFEAEQGFTARIRFTYHSYSLCLQLLISQAIRILRS